MSDVRRSGERLTNPCEGCGGEGRRQTSETVTVDVPPGVDDGTRLRVTGRGEAGRQGGPTGDLYVRVRVRPHRVFTRDGNDLHCELALSMAQAALGGDVTVPTLHGDETLRVPPGTQSGAVLTVRRAGMPKLSGGGARGSLHVHCRVETPATSTTSRRRCCAASPSCAVSNWAPRPPTARACSVACARRSDRDGARVTTPDAVVA